MDRPRQIAVLGLVTGALLASGVAPALAAIELYTDADVGGFVADTATADFLDAIAGSERLHTVFQVDIEGAPLPNDGGVPGDELSPAVVLASPSSSIPTEVLATGAAEGQGRVGPSPGFLGTLEIDFGAAGATATAVGFGPVGLGTAASIRIFDPEDEELLATSDASNNGFTFVGVTVSGEDLISRVVVEGASPYALQDLQYVVPEPGAALQGVAAVASLGLLGLLRQRRQGVVAGHRR